MQHTKKKLDTHRPVTLSIKKCMSSDFKVHDDHWKETILFAYIHSFIVSGFKRVSEGRRHNWIV